MMPRDLGAARRSRVATRWLMALLLCCAGLSVVVPCSAQTTQYTIAVVRDGPGFAEVDLEQVRSELDHMLGSEAAVELRQDPAFDAGWDPSRASAVVRAALDAPGIDLVIGTGRLVIQAAAEPSLELTRPFVGAVAQLGEVPRVPYSADDFSTKPNLSFVVVPRGEDAALQIFQDMIRFDRLHVLIEKIEQENLVGFPEEIEGRSRSLGIEVIAVPVETTAAPVLAVMDSTVQGVLLTALPRLPEAERQALIDGLNERGIPSFSSEGEVDLERGVLATNLQDLRRQTARRVANNAHRLLGGEDTSVLPVFLLPESRLQINGRTSARIGFQPGFNTRIEAEVLHAEALESGFPELDLAQTFALADTGNATLAITGATVEQLIGDKDVQKADLLPQFGVTGTYQAHNYEGIQALFPEQMGTVGFQLEQMIYNDRTISQYRSSGRLAEAGQHRYEMMRLMVKNRAGTNYLAYVQARLYLGIEMDNLRLTEANLRIAQTRVDVGEAGRDEVYRWEAQLAEQRGRVVNSEANVEAARLSLNQTLGLEQDHYWRPAEIAVDTTGIALYDGSLDFITHSQSVYEQFSEAAVKYALWASPEVAYFQKQIEAQAIQVGQAKRSYFLPQVGLTARHDMNVYTSDDQGLNDDGSILWLKASLPLFEGTRRINNVKRQSASQRAIEYQLTRAQQMVERRTRTVLARLESSYPNLRFARTAAEKARQNFEVVREKYANGIVTITRLLEAQNAAFNAQLQSTGADYVFLKDLIDLQRSLAFYPAEHTSEEQQAFVAEIRAIMEGREPGEKDDDHE